MYNICMALYIKVISPQLHGLPLFVLMDSTPCLISHTLIITLSRPALFLTAG